MQPSRQLWFPNRLYVALQLAALSVYACARICTWVMLIPIAATILPWQTSAETTSPDSSYTSEHASDALRRGVVTVNSNLRSSPSLRSEVVAVTKEGTRVKILMESARWYQVRSEEGVEAWIYKPLVRIEQEPMQSSSGTPVALAQSDIPKAAFAVAATSDVFVELQAANTAEEPSWDTALAVPIDAPPVLPQMIWTAWVVDRWLSHLLSPAAYVVMALLMVLALSITLQLRSAKQLRRAMREMGHILDVVEEIYARGLLARTSTGSTALHLAPAEALAQEPAPPQIGFSFTEYAVLEALSDQQEVQEAELGKILAEKGFAGMLIKAVIGNIVRKTGIRGVPWVEVRHVQGRYCYRLRAEGVPNLKEHRLERP
jgi:SH3-like domain-containing protein